MRANITVIDQGTKEQQVFSFSDVQGVYIDTMNGYQFLTVVTPTEHKSFSMQVVTSVVVA